MKTSGRLTSPHPTFSSVLKQLQNWCRPDTHFPRDYASARKNAKFEQGVVKHGRGNGYGAPDLCLMQVPPRVLIFTPCLIQTGVFVLVLFKITM
jgi:hypothetical protein